MAIPETDIRRIQLGCCEWVPEHLWPQVKVEVDVEGAKHPCYERMERWMIAKR